MLQKVLAIYAGESKRRQLDRKRRRYNKEAWNRENNMRLSVLAEYQNSGETTPELDDFFERWNNLLVLIDPEPAPEVP